MRVVFVLLVVLAALVGCGPEAPPSPWVFDVRDATGRRVDVSDHGMAVLFAPDASPVWMASHDAFNAALRLPPLESGHYEFWLPGHKPIRIDAPEPSVLQLEAGYRIKVWVPHAANEERPGVIISARWRGSGTHPEALLRTILPCAAPPAGERSWPWIATVKGGFAAPGQAWCEIEVPWPGAYRLEPLLANVDLTEYQPGGMTGSMNTSRWSGMATSIVVPPTSEPLEVTLGEVLRSD